MSNKYSCSLFSVKKEDVSHEDEAVSRPLVTRGVMRLQIHHRSTAGRVAAVLRVGLPMPDPIEPGYRQDPVRSGGGTSLGSKCGRGELSALG